MVAMMVGSMVEEMAACLGVHWVEKMEQGLAECLVDMKAELLVDLSVADSERMKVALKVASLAC